MKTLDAAKRLNLATSTLRLWTRGEWKDYLSSTAQGGRRRDFTELDVRVLQFIADEKAKNVPAEEIHIALRAMRSDEWKGLPQLPDSPAGEGPVSMIPREAAESRVEEMRKRYMREIAQLEDDIEELEHKLDTEREAHNDTRDRMQGELVKLEREAGELRGKLDTLAQQDTRQTRLWLAVIVGALLAAGGIGALIAFLLSSGG
ncbi:MAG: MerR family transcriptional regulator [Chloroflexota bacterium]